MDDRALASALGIGVGGGLAWIMEGFQSGHGFIYSLCAGLIIGLLFFEMIPESIELGGWVILLWWNSNRLSIIPIHSSING
ncbi:hypothetical protein AAHB43_03255 [Staphylococcus pseudintermedius]